MSTNVHDSAPLLDLPPLPPSLASSSTPPLSPSLFTPFPSPTPPPPLPLLLPFLPSPHLSRILLCVKYGACHLLQNLKNSSPLCRDYIIWLHNVTHDSPACFIISAPLLNQQSTWSTLNPSSEISESRCSYWDTSIMGCAESRTFTWSIIVVIHVHVYCWFKGVWVVWVWYVYICVQENHELTSQNKEHSDKDCISRARYEFLEIWPYLHTFPIRIIAMEIQYFPPVYEYWVASMLESLGLQVGSWTEL